MNLFTKTYSKDAGWLELAIISVMRNTQTEIDWTIVCDRGERGLFERIISETQRFIPAGGPNVRINSLEIQDKWPDASPMGSGYIQQQWVKMTAHRVMGSDYFLNWDSDVVALRPFSDASFKNISGKPILWFTPFNDLIIGGDAPIHRSRQGYIKNIFQLPEAPFEWMRCMPIWINGEILRVAEARTEWTRAAIMMRSNQVDGLSEFNLIGQMSNMLFPDAYDYRNTIGQETWSGPLNGERNIVHQSWSWGQDTSQVREIVMKGL